MKTYWHFVSEDRRLSYTGEVVEVGRTYRVPGPPKLCKHGLHASERAIDALLYAPGPIICRVHLDGDIRHAEDKSVATERTVLAMADATDVLHEFACWCAEMALIHVDIPDPRSVAVIEAKRARLYDIIDNANMDVTEIASEVAAECATWLGRKVATKTAQNTQLEIMLNALLDISGNYE